MDSMAMMELVARLYTVLSGITGYPLPETMPRLERLPRAVLQERVCARPCQIRAFYHPDVGVILDDSLNLTSSAYDQSILLHELVHHAQHAAGAFAESTSPCLARSAAERQAYEVQNRFLAQSPGGNRIPSLRWELMCDPLQ